MPTPPEPDIRATLLQVIAEHAAGSEPSQLQSRPVLREAALRVGAVRDLPKEHALLTQWHELFRTGYLAWGYNIDNADPPFFHLTQQGRAVLSQVSRDPSNPDGYLRHLRSVAENLNEVAESYIVARQSG